MFSSFCLEITMSSKKEKLLAEMHPIMNMMRPMRDSFVTTAKRLVLKYIVTKRVIVRNSVKNNFRYQKLEWKYDIGIGSLIFSEAFYSYEVINNSSLNISYSILTLIRFQKATNG